MSSCGLKAFLCFQMILVFFWFHISKFCCCFKFHFDWKTKRFEMLSIRMRVVRCIMFSSFLIMLLLLALSVYRPLSISLISMFVKTVLVPYPLNYFYKLLTQQRCTVRHLNQLFRCLLDTQKLTDRHLIISGALYCTLVFRLLNFAALVTYVVYTFLPVSFAEFLEDISAATFLILMIIVSLHPLIGVYTYSHFVCVELFCFRTVMVHLNDDLSDWVEDFSFYRHLRVTKIFKPKLRELVRIYRRLLRSFDTFNHVLGEDAVALLFMMCLAFVYLLDSLFQSYSSMVSVWLFAYFGCLGDVVYGYIYYRRICFELSRTQTLVEAVVLRPEYHMDRQMNYILGAVEIGKLGMDVPRKRAQKAFCSVIGIISLRFFCNMGQLTFKV